MPLGGTWKLDMESVAKQMPPTSDKNAAEVEMIAMKTERLRSVRYILNNTSGVIVNEGIPNVVSWMTTKLMMHRLSLRILMELKNLQLK